jgi:hypothetical protein
MTLQLFIVAKKDTAQHFETRFVVLVFDLIKVSENNVKEQLHEIMRIRLQNSFQTIVSFFKT